VRAAGLEVELTEGFICGDAVGFAYIFGEACLTSGFSGGSSMSAVLPLSGRSLLGLAVVIPLSMRRAITAKADPVSTATSVFDSEAMRDAIGSFCPCWTEASTLASQHDKISATRAVGSAVLESPMALGSFSIFLFCDLGAQKIV